MHQNQNKNRGQGGRGGRGGRGSGGRGRGYADGFRRRPPDSRANNRFGSRSPSPQANNRGGSRSNSWGSDGNRSPSGFRGPSGPRMQNPDSGFRRPESSIGSNNVRRQNSPSAFRGPSRSNDVRRQNMSMEQNRMEQNFEPRSPRRHENVLERPGNNRVESRSNTWDSDGNRSHSGFGRHSGSQDVRMQNPDSGFRRPESPLRSNDVRRQNMPTEQNFETRDPRRHENVQDRPGSTMSQRQRDPRWNEPRQHQDRDSRVHSPAPSEQSFRFSENWSRDTSPRGDDWHRRRSPSPTPSNWSRGQWDHPNERGREDQQRRRSRSPTPEAHNGPSSSRRTRSIERRSPELKPYERKYENVQQDMSAERITQQIREAAMSRMSGSEFGRSRAGGSIRQGSVTPRGSERRGSDDRWSRRTAGGQDRNQQGCSAWGSGRQGDVTPRGSERGGSDGRRSRQQDTERYSPRGFQRPGDIMPFGSERRDFNDNRSRQPDPQGYPPRGSEHQEDLVPFGSERRFSNDSRASQQDYQGDWPRGFERPGDVTPRGSERGSDGGRSRQQGPQSYSPRGSDRQGDVTPRGSERSSSIESRSRQQGPQSYSPRGSDRQGGVTPRRSGREGSIVSWSGQQGPQESGSLGPNGSERKGSNDSRPRGFDQQDSRHQSPEPDHRQRSNSYGSDYQGPSHPSPPRENWSIRSPDNDVHSDDSVIYPDSGEDSDTSFSLSPTFVEELRQEMANPLGLRGARNPRGRGGAPRGIGFLARGGFLGRGGFGMIARRRRIREALNDREIEEVPVEEEIRLPVNQDWMQGLRRPPNEPAFLWNRNFMGRPYPQGPLPEDPMDRRRAARRQSEDITDRPDRPNRRPDRRLIRHLASKQSQDHLRNDCIYCGNNTHQHDKCPFMPDINERRNWLLSRGRCLRCFKPHRHTGRECEEMGKRHQCWYCLDSDPNDLHHSSICPVAVNQEAPIQPGQLDRQDLPDRPPIRHLASKDAQEQLRNSCFYCGRYTHHHDKCPFVPDIDERRDYLLLRERCLRCFRYHIGRGCEEMGHFYRCRYCHDSDPNYLHHQSICPVAVNQEASIQPGQQDRPDQHDRPDLPDSYPIRHLASENAQDRFPNSCIYCGKYNHQHDKCPTVPDINERRDYLLSNGSCLRCFRPHRTTGRECEEMGKRYQCRYCLDSDPDYLHHSSICPVAVNQEAPN
ncbi:hypothetical protein B9Z55_012360 [Caenorhabditis nigoni]|uniref:CCHC-type domain-containing protein n=1 Tax=Caenorhabditis nigoni TaxID=1611254 RepID=A0A2G5TWV1_9PELO|nr:hypothetical protein B9Z55_012360 [Caenorhabditis nigoni]